MTEYELLKKRLDRIERQVGRVLSEVMLHTKAIESANEFMANCSPRRGIIDGDDFNRWIKSKEPDD